MKIPQHIVIVPDGNRRWAQSRGESASFGHAEGAKNFDRVLHAALQEKIAFFTAWLCSVKNITERSAVEVAFLYKLFEDYFKKLAKAPEIKEKRIRVNVLGRWQEFFPASLKRTIASIVDDTKQNTGCTLTFLMAYSGKDEMLDAVSKIARTRGETGNKKVTAEMLKQNLWTKDLPAVDLVIRTGGEPHWSAGFMMWDVADSQLYFTETFWPAFSVDEFRRAIATFSATERRYGV